MFYTEAERQVYPCAALSDRLFDPLHLYRQLVIYTAGKIDDLLADWQGDEAVDKAKAEEKLVCAVRLAFNLKTFTEPDGCTDAVALEALVDYLEWMGKKETRVNTTPTSVFTPHRTSNS